MQWINQQIKSVVCSILEQPLNKIPYFQRYPLDGQLWGSEVYKNNFKVLLNQAEEGPYIKYIVKAPAYFCFAEPEGHKFNVFILYRHPFYK